MKFTEEEKEQVKSLRIAGAKIRDIATGFGVSTFKVWALLNESGTSKPDVWSKKIALKLRAMSEKKGGDGPASKFYKIPYWRFHYAKEFLLRSTTTKPIR